MEVVFVRASAYNVRESETEMAIGDWAVWIGQEKRNCASGVRKAQGCGWNHGSGKTGEDVSTPSRRGLHGLRILRGAEGAYSDVATDGRNGAGTVSGGFSGAVSVVSGRDW